MAKQDKDTRTSVRVVQVRLMGEEADVKLVVEALLHAGFASTGSTPNRDQAGVRTYGVIPVPAQ
jgi:hypothetical protein